MANDAFQSLKAAIKSGEPATCYIFHGEEAYLRGYYTQKLRDLVCDGPAGEFNYHKLEARGLTARQVSDALEAMPMMGGRTLVELDDYDLYKSSERDQWVEILSDLPPYATLLFVYDTVEWKPDKRIKKLTEAIDTHVHVVEFEKQSPRQLVDWLRRRLRSLEKEIDDDVAEYLIFRTGGDMTLLGMEGDKLAAYAAARKITRSDVDTVTEPVLEARVFDMTDAIATRRFDKAMQILEDLLRQQEEPIVILAAIGSQMRRLYGARVLMDVNARGEVKSLYKLGDFPARKTLDAAGKLSRNWCAMAVQECELTDFRLKTSFDDKNRLLELLLTKLMLEAKS